MDAASLLTGLLLGALLATAVTLGVVALLAPAPPRGRRARAGARVAGPPAPAAGRHGARPRHRARRAARADGHGRPDLGPAQAGDGGAGHGAAHAARARPLGRGAAAPGRRGGRPARALRLRRAARRHQRRRAPASGPTSWSPSPTAGRWSSTPRCPSPATSRRCRPTDQAVRAQRVADARPPAARPRRRARRPPLPHRVPAGGAVHGAVRPLRRLPHHRAGGRARAARVRLRPRRRPGDAEHAARAAAHRRLLVAAGAAGPRRRPGARGRPAAARPAEHAVGPPHPARLGARAPR